MEIIKKYIDMLESALGLDIIIYIENRLLSKTGLIQLPQLGKWHTNPYCLKIKESRELHGRCVSLKPAFVNKVLRGEGVVKSTCFCGVTEYVCAIKHGEHLICLVSATGFLGNVREGMDEFICDRVGIDYKELRALRQKVLLPTDNEQHVICAVEILSSMIQRYIEEETEIPTLLRELQHEGNGHVVRAMEYISKNFTERISTESVAEHCHLSVSHLKHLFLKVIGHGVAEEIRLCRLAYAEELLCTTEYSIKYISFISGFSSADYFSTAFKCRFKLTPNQYRRQKTNRYDK